MPHAALVPTLFAIPTLAMPALAHVMGRLADTHAASPCGRALASLCDPATRFGIARGVIIVDVNQGYADLVGYDREEMRGRSIAEFVAGPYTAPVNGYRQKIVPIRHRDGRIISVRCCSYPLVTDCLDRLVVFEEV